MSDNKPQDFFCKINVKKQRSIKMPTLNDLIVTEIKKQLKRTPTPAEILDAAMWLGEHIKENSDFLDYQYEILMWSQQLTKGGTND
jgi:hypothetical protein